MQVWQLLFVTAASGSDTFGNPGDFTNTQTFAPDETSEETAVETRYELDDFGTGTTAPPPATLIYTCGGTAEKLGFCQFPFATLAGNEYTHTCADKVEDNPDYTVDRPWCFTSASEWGFCDCDAFFDLTYVTLPNAHDATLRDIQIQVTLDYPGTIWCALSANKTHIPSLADIQQNAKPTEFVGATGIMMPEMILRDLVAHVVFSATPAFMKTRPFLSCQAHVPGLLKQPEPIGMVLGSNRVDPGGNKQPDDEDEDPPHLITETSGAMMYSTLIIMLLSGFIGVRYAMDRRDEMLKFALLGDPAATKY